jgi:hypothetical protein
MIFVARVTLYKRGETVINDFAPITELSRYVRFINLNYVRGWLICHFFKSALGPYNKVYYLALFSVYLNDLILKILRLPRYISSDDKSWQKSFSK